MSSGRFAVLPAHLIDDPAITLTQFKIIACLETYADHEGWAWPRIGTLATRCGFARSTVKRALYDLIERGYIERTERAHPDGRQTANLYRLVYDPAKLDAAAAKPVPMHPGADLEAEALEDEGEGGGSPVDRGVVHQRTGGWSTSGPGGGSPVDHLKRTQLNEDKKTTTPPTPPGGKALEEPGWCLTPELLEFARSQGFQETEAHAQFDRCKDHYASFGTEIRNPAACFRQWLRRAHAPKAAAGEGTPTPQAPAAAIFEFKAIYAADVPEAIRDQWARALIRLGQTLGPVQVKQWFERVTVKWSQSQGLELACPSAFHRDWIFEKFAGALEDARAGELTETNLRLTIEGKKAA